MTDRLEQLTKLHDADPTDPFTAYGIALEHAKAARHQDALHWLDQTLELDAQYCYAYYQKARIQSETGKHDDARQTLQVGMTTAQQAGDDHAREEMATLLETIP